MDKYHLCDTCSKHIGHQWTIKMGGRPVAVCLDGCKANSPDAGRIVMHDGIERPTDLCPFFESKIDSVAQARGARE